MAIDPRSDTWLTITSEIEERGGKALDRLKKRDTDLQKTEFQRGYLKALDEILTLAGNRTTTG